MNFAIIEMLTQVKREAHLIAFVLSKFWAVAPHVITSVRGVWSHSFAKSTTLAAMLLVLVAVCFSKLWAVAILIRARLGSC